MQVINLYFRILLTLSIFIKDMAFSKLSTPQPTEELRQKSCLSCTLPISAHRKTSSSLPRPRMRLRRSFSPSTKRSRSTTGLTLMLSPSLSTSNTERNDTAFLQKRISLLKSQYLEQSTFRLKYLNNTHYYYSLVISSIKGFLILLFSLELSF